MGSQKLRTEFFAKENSKPLFKANNILTVFNAHIYHTTIETFKILKYRRSISLYSLYHQSDRKQTLLILPSNTHDSSFIYRSSQLWNLVRQKLKLYEFSDFKVSKIKISLQRLLFKFQSEGDEIAWNDSEINVINMLKSNRMPDFIYEDKKY